MESSSERKAFFVGLNRTGTSSYTAFLNSLGMPCYQEIDWWYWTDPQLFKGYSGFTNGFERCTPTNLPHISKYSTGWHSLPHFPDIEFLSSNFPGSFFFANTRSLRTWLISRLAHYLSVPETDTFRKLLANGVEPLSSSDELLMRWVFDRISWSYYIRHFLNQSNFTLLDLDSDPLSKIKSALGISGKLYSNPYENKSNFGGSASGVVDKFLFKYIEDSDHDSLLGCSLKDGAIEEINSSRDIYMLANAALLRPNVPPKKTIRAIFFGNCQIEAICKTIESTMPELESSIFLNYQLISLGAEDIDNRLKEKLDRADVLIYQPLDCAYGKYSVLPSAHGMHIGNLLKYAKSGIRCLAIPYIYNDYLWPFFHEGDKWKHAHTAFMPYLEKSLNADQVVALYKANAVDFRYSERYAHSMRLLRDKERFCDIKISHLLFLLGNDVNLFLTQNHPSSFVINYISQQVFLRLVEWFAPENTSETSFKPSIIPFADSESYPLEHTASSHFGFEGECKRISELESSNEYWISLISKVYAELQMMHLK